jgi:excisionase family DNA binding protein
MRIMQDPGGAELMSAEDVESLLGIDKSTVYRMAQDGRLPAIKVGRQWRFPAGPIRGLLEGAGIELSSATAGPRSPRLPAVLASADALHLQPLIDLAADLLGVMMVVTDMEGNPASEVANPCAWFAERQEDPAVLEACLSDWRALANEQAFAPTFRVGPHGFECARALVREGNQLVGMVLAGGVAPGDLSPEGSRDVSDGLYHLTAADRAVVLAALPRVAASLSRVASRPEPTTRSE